MYITHLYKSLHHVPVHIQQGTHMYRYLHTTGSRGSLKTAETGEEVNITVSSVSSTSQELCHWLMKGNAPRGRCLNLLLHLITKEIILRNEGDKPIQASDSSVGLGVTMLWGCSVTGAMEEKASWKRNSPNNKHRTRHVYLYSTFQQHGHSKCFK